MTANSLRENRHFAARNVDLAASCALLGANMSAQTAHSILALDVLQLAKQRTEAPEISGLFDIAMAARLMAITRELKTRGAHVTLAHRLEDRVGLFLEPVYNLLAEVTPPDRNPRWPGGFRVWAYDPRLTQKSIDQAPSLIDADPELNLDMTSARQRRLSKPKLWSRALLNLAYSTAPNTANSAEDKWLQAASNVDFVTNCALLGAGMPPMVVHAMSSMDVLRLAQGWTASPLNAPQYETAIAARLMAITYELNARGAQVRLYEDFEDSADLFAGPILKLLAEVTPPRGSSGWPAGLPICAYDPRLTRQSISLAPNIFEIPASWSHALLEQKPVLANLEGGPGVFRTAML